MFGRLHRGELEVVQAAKELNINIIIIDDRAKDMLLKPIGINGILQLAKKVGKISEIKPYLDMLIGENYRISKLLYLEALRLREKKKECLNKKEQVSKRLNVFSPLRYLAPYPSPSMRNISIHPTPKGVGFLPVGCN